MEKPYAIVIDLDNITGLQTARILAKRGVPVMAIAKNPNHFCCRTSACEKLIRADTANEEFIQALIALGPNLDQKAVLFPCSDMSVLLVSRHRAKLEEWYHIVLPQPDVVEMLLDKVSFYTFAQRERLPIPVTSLLRSRADVQHAAEKLTFPCVLKPAKRTRLWMEHVKAKVFKVSSAEELFQVYDHWSRWTDVLIAQEKVEGSDANHYTCNCYFNADAKPVVTFVTRKVRQWPPEIGISSLRVECRNDVVRDQTIRLFENVRYRGLGYLEMKRVQDTDEYLIIEPNIGRPTGGSAISEAGGVELLFTMYCDAVGWPLPPNLEQKYGGVKWIHLSSDILSSLYYWRRRELTFMDWYRSLRGRKAYAVFSWTDPAPFWGQLPLVIGILVGYLKAKMRQLSNRWNAA